MTVRKFNSARAGIRGLIGLVALSSLAPCAQAQASDIRAEEAVELFTAFCFAPMGSREAATQVLGEGNAITHRLPDDIVREMHGGQEGGVGWAIISPGDARLTLDFDALGFCSVRIQGADKDSVITAFERMVAALSEDMRIEPILEQTENYAIDGVTIDAQAYSLSVPDGTVHLRLSAADQLLGGQQHLLTFLFDQ